ncbi:hypothetical protein DFH09DRAFT_58376 [Mycena vulgaris]|nr:hypothetical protein DFH09DRAFT_58376 [Mycena vulgaris]
MASIKAKLNAPNDAGLSSSYTALSSLGAPVTVEEFTRLYNGPLADALHFLSEHVIGRQKAASARIILLRSQEERAKSNLKQPDTTRSTGDKAVARLSSAKQTSEVYTIADADNLQKKLDHKRRLLLLLQVLEAKQNLRTKRIEEMTGTINDLRTSVGQSRKEIVSFANPPEMPSLAWSRISNSRDSMADLHNYGIRLSRLLEPPASGNETLRLQRVVARSLGPNHPDTARALEQCISYARTLVDHKLQSKIQRRSADIRQLEVKLHSNKEKELKVQKLVDLSTALRTLCDQHAASIVDFTEILSHSLRRSLKEESRLSKGHVDISRSLMVADRPAEPRETPSFLGLVTQVFRMHGNVKVRNILDEFERVIKQSHRRFNLVDPDRLPRPVVADTALIDEYRSNTQTAHDRATKLLTRKAEKAVMGRSLASDVEALLRESRLALGLVSKN